MCRKERPSIITSSNKWDGVLKYLEQHSPVDGKLLTVVES
jgi:hypothetical protein